MLSLKHSGGKITFHVFLLTWPWPWPNNLHIRTWSVCPENLPDEQECTSHVKGRYGSFR